MRMFVEVSCADISPEASSNIRKRHLLALTREHVLSITSINLQMPRTSHMLRDFTLSS